MIFMAKILFGTALLWWKKGFGQGYKRQKAEDRSRKTEVRSQKSGVRSQKSGDRIAFSI